MLIDETKIILKAGHGGAGKMSFYAGQYSGPDGGNGGRGGDVYVKVDSDLFLLNQFSSKKLLSAQNGEMGSNNRKFGKNGADLVVHLPLGAEFTNLITGEKIELTKVGQHFLICKGGLGGRGNFELKSSTRTTPEYAQPGLPGEEKNLLVNLKLIADFGLVGLPNSGKSSLLNELTRANAKVANYPFTTLEPNLGVINGKIIADIPGLIEGASEGKGLGIKFLKHIEKVSMLLHCISSEGLDILADYKTIAQEMENFNPELLNKKQIILLTKSDLVSKDELKKKLSQLKGLKKKVLSVSIYDFDSLENLKTLLT